jgi:hypothetical protein
MSPHVAFFDSRHGGYSVAEFTREACSYDAHAVDKTARSRPVGKRRLASLTVPGGAPEIRRETN